MTALRQTRFPHALALIAAAFLPLPALAQSTIYVAPCGDDAWTGSSAVCAAPDGPKSTLQAAINASNNGDTVIAADGTYTGAGNFNLTFGGRAITLRSSGGAAACIIDLQASTSAFRRGFIFSSGETGASILQGFTIRNGVESRGGAIYCENSSPLIRDCILQQNTAWTQIDDDGGGAVYILRSQPTFINCEFVQNHVECHLPLADGGGITSNNSSPTFIDCIFRQNTAAGPGGAGDVAGLSVFYGGHATILNCQFIGNHSARCCGAAWIGTQGTEATIINSSFIGNIAANEGGGGLVVQRFATVVIRDSHFESNSAVGGGGLWIGDSAVVDVVNCTISSNSANTGAGLSLTRAAQLTATNTLFSKNHANLSGGALQIFVDSLATLVNCTLAENSAGSAGGALRISSTSAGPVNIRNSVVWGNRVNTQPNQFSILSPITLASSTVQGGWGTTPSLDPLFVNPPAGNFRLRPGSPCIDSANNTLVPSGILTDLDGNPRFHDDPASPNTGIPGGAGGPAITDMGAYEFHFCYPNCDASTAAPLLNVEDFSCFINEFAAAQALPHQQQLAHYANCDQSTTPPVLNVEDFSCFINRFVQGCP
jgi:hypothetical protein